MQLLLLCGCLVLPVLVRGGAEVAREILVQEGGLLIPRCSGAVNAGEDSQEGRVSVRDKPQELRFTVTLRNLTLQDAGKYWCGVQRLGLDETVLVSLLVFPGPCCPPSPSPSFQPLATTSLQPKVKAWQTQPPELRIAYPATQLHSTLAKGTGPSSSSSSKPRVSIPTVRILAPVLVLLALLLATALAALGSHMLCRRKEVPLATETERNEKVDFSGLPPGNSWVPEYAVINLAGTSGPTGPPVSPEPSASPYMEIQLLSQTPAEEEALQDPEGDRIPVPPANGSGEELGFPKFTSV